MIDAETTLKQLRARAIGVTRQLPEAHDPGDRTRQIFAHAVGQFVSALYNLGPNEFEDISDFEAAENAAAIVMRAVEIHVLAGYDAHDAGAVQEFSCAIQSLRRAQEGLARGLPPDPERRPTDKEIREFGRDLLLRVLEERPLSV